MNTIEKTEPVKIPVTTTASTEAAGADGPVHVWLVDDHDRLRGMIAEALEQRGGIVCTRQFDSPNALLSALASRIGPDVILLDVQMGEFNGLDAIPAIKSLSRDTQVLMLTTSFDPEWKTQALESGATDYLLKTYPAERIAERIKTCRGTGERAHRLPGRAVRARFGVRSAAAGRLGDDFEAVAAGESESNQSPFLRWLRSFAKN